MLYYLSLIMNVAFAVPMKHSARHGQLLTKSLSVNRSFLSSRLTERKWFCRRQLLAKGAADKFHIQIETCKINIKKWECSPHAEEVAFKWPLRIVCSGINYVVDGKNLMILSLKVKAAEKSRKIPFLNTDLVDPSCEAREFYGSRLVMNFYDVLFIMAQRYLPFNLGRYIFVPGHHSLIFGSVFNNPPATVLYHLDNEIENAHCHISHAIHYPVLNRTLP